MPKHTIEIEGLPEGWEPIAFRVPLETDKYWNVHNVCDGKYGNNGFGSIIVQKTKPRRIVLEETGDIREAERGDWVQEQNDMEFRRWDYANGSRQKYKIWREVKEE